VLLSACSTSGHLDVPWLRLSLHLPGATPAASAEAGLPEGVSTPVPSSTPVPAIPVAQFVPIAESFVEVHRGLRFKTPVKVTLLDDAAFRQRLLGKGSSSTEQDQSLATTAKELVALHLLDRSVDISSSTQDLLGTGVSGFYDPQSKDLVVRGTGATPYVRQVIVHELTHALQDQWFGIDRPQLDAGNDERGIAFRSVVEGDAVRIEGEYHESMTPAEQEQADAEEQSQSVGGSGDSAAGAPRVLLELLSFPYVAGPLFVEALDRLGGQAKVDSAFVHPPVDTAQLLDPTRYLDGDTPRNVAVPRADGTAFDHGVLGALGLLLLFEDVDAMSDDQAVEIASLWGGDQYAAWQKGNQSCMRVAVLARTAGSQPTLDSALRDYARSVGGTFVPGASGRPSVVTSCG
jgi:hypothetical protein